MSERQISVDPLAPVLRPVRGGNGFEEALEQVLQVVRLGLVPDGERLPAERELAERLRISRVTLREVLKVLHDQGLVETRRGRHGGTFVRNRTPSHGAGRAEAETELRRRAAGLGAGGLDDVLRFREVLEVGAAGLCARTELTEEQAGLLRRRLRETGDAPTADYRRADTLLHLTIAELCGSPSLATQYAAVRAQVNELLDCIPILVRNLEHSQGQHTALVEAILDGEEAAAAAVMREHAEGTAALLRGFLA
ncbi:FCD domain-containing protein [Streptomyces sp. H10-C2]|uniref:FadR/GntR family transcriptional regulator n=1 Tax=unclassified Streptomyces TaxID=2593676 RepID=UPI0024BB2C27|nr:MULTISPECIES: FCD domain-containing protein [unclassified Streptomyces]MDJ0345278.1 FCD domain-containing protein [Streptomyces sp. PH10-H1]MDJ0370729.1 FCD domain-containing protein [Streptomyces sp. H10-C2]